MKNLQYSLLLIATLFVVPTVQAQFSNTVFSKIMANSVPPAGAVTVLNSSNNIGQSQHLFLVVSKDAPAHTCNTYFSAVFQGSYDGVYYFNLPTAFQSYQRTNAATNRASRLYFSQGAYPAMGVLIVNADNLNCLYDVQYTGILYPQPIAPLTTTTSAPSNVTGAVGVAAAQGQSLSSGDNVLLGGAIAGAIIQPYGVTLCNHTAATTYVLKECNPSNCSVAVVPLLEIPAMAVGQCFTLPVNPLPLYPGETIDSAALVLNASQVATASYNIVYRLE